jgi:hypothetical protein
MTDPDANERLDAIEQELALLREMIETLHEAIEARQIAERRLGRAVERLMRAHKDLIGRAGVALTRAERRNPR